MGLCALPPVPDDAPLYTERIEDIPAWAWCGDARSAAEIETGEVR